MLRSVGTGSTGDLYPPALWIGHTPYLLSATYCVQIGAGLVSYSMAADWNASFLFRYNIIEISLNTLCQCMMHTWTVICGLWQSLCVASSQWWIDYFQSKYSTYAHKCQMCIRAAQHTKCKMWNHWNPSRSTTVTDMVHHIPVLRP